MRVKVRWLWAGLVAACLPACGDGGTPPRPDVAATTAASAAGTASDSATASATASDSATASVTASDSATAEVAPSASATAEPVASASGSASATAAPSGSTSAAPAAKGFAFPAPKSGVLKVAEADKLVKVGAPARARLLDPGKEPHEKLAYALVKGDTQKLRVELSQKMSVMAQGQRGPKVLSPPQALDVDVTVEDVDDTSSALVAMMLRGISLTAADGIDQDTANELTKQLAGLSGYSFRERVAANGEASAGEVKLPASAPQGADMLVASMNTVLRVLVPRLPDEPVGAGARWQVMSREDQGGASVVQLTEYTLKDRSGTKVTLDFTTRQLAAGETMKMPAGVPAGVGTKVTKFATSLGGSLSLDTTQMGPIKGRVTQATKLALDVTAPGMAAGGAMKTETEMKMTVTIARRGGGAAGPGSAAASATPTASATATATATATASQEEAKP